MTNPQIATQAEKILLSQQRKGNVNKRYGPLITMLGKKLNVSEIVAGEILDDLASEGYLSLPFPKRHGGTVSLHIPDDYQHSQTEKDWNGVIDTLNIPQELKSELAQKARFLDGLSLDDMKILANGLMQFSKVKFSDDIDPFEVSARYLLGSSKAYQKFGSTSGFPNIQTSFNDKSSYAVTAGSASPGKVLLVENPVSFEACLRCNLDQNDLIICTFGFGVNWAGITSGKKQIRPLVRRGEFPDLRSVLLDSDVYFWGDLDKGGMRIYADIKKHIPDLMFSSLYIPLERALSNGSCHPYISLVEKTDQANLALPNIEDPVYQMLCTLCDTRGVDQEIVTDEEILDLGIGPRVLDKVAHI